MLHSKFVRATSVIALLVATIGIMATGCNQGDTGGGAGRDDAGLGEQFVSNGGAGSTLTITVDDHTDTAEIAVAERKDFRVSAFDPNGLPLQFIRIFCETEHGIAILEPSNGGVAFEHTNRNGFMSGVIGGLTPGSYLMECRAPEGFNLVARIHIRVTGDVPEGFDGFPGAAGGNLGGGLLVEEPTSEELDIREIRFIDVTGAVTRNGPIDTQFNNDCNQDGLPRDPENYGYDNYQITITNSRSSRVFVESITYVVQDGRNVTATQLQGQLTIDAESEVNLVDSFTEFLAGANQKTFAATSAVIINGTYNVQFTVRGSTAEGDSFSLTKSANVTFGPVDRC